MNSLAGYLFFHVRITIWRRAVFNNGLSLDLSCRAHVYTTVENGSFGILDSLRQQVKVIRCCSLQGLELWVLCED